MLRVLAGQDPHDFEVPAVRKRFEEVVAPHFFVNGRGGFMTRPTFSESFGKPLVRHPSNTYFYREGMYPSKFGKDKVFVRRRTLCTRSFSPNIRYTDDY